MNREVLDAEKSFDDAKKITSIQTISGAYRQNRLVGLTLPDSTRMVYLTYRTDSTCWTDLT